MVELLLIEGSEVDVRDNVTGKTALIKAAYGGHFKVVNLLLEAEADPDAVDSQGYGALAFAASFGHREVLASLLEHDADPDVADLFGITPLIHAAARGDFLSVRLLLEAGATATREDVEGKSALDYADSAGFDDVVAILADYASRDPNTAGMLQSTAGAMTERLAQIENVMEEQSMSPNKGSGTQRQKEGPANLSMTKGYKTSQALSTLNKLLAANMLRRGNGLYTTPASRRKERLFGVTGSGRTSARRAGVKLENLAVDYRPQLDTVLKAYVRLLAVRAEAAALEEASMAEEEAGTAE